MVEPGSPAADDPGGVATLRPSSFGVPAHLDCHESIPDLVLVEFDASDGLQAMENLGRIAGEIHGTLVKGGVSARLNNMIGTVGSAPCCRHVSAMFGTAMARATDRGAVTQATG